MTEKPLRYRWGILFSSPVLAADYYHSYIHRTVVTLLPSVVSTVGENIKVCRLLFSTASKFRANDQLEKFALLLKLKDAPALFLVVVK